MTDIPANARWMQNGVTLAGGNGKGNATNQLNHPDGLLVDDDDQTLFIVDTNNNRIVKWKIGNTSGQIVAGGNGIGKQLDQLSLPKSILIDKVTDSLIISDDQRVVQWPLRDDKAQGKILIDNIQCQGLAMDVYSYLYVSDKENNEVRRYKIGDKTATIVAGGHGEGDGLHQLNFPTEIFVDEEQNVYVVDSGNHRVMKWIKGAAEGLVIAGGQGKGNALTQLYLPCGLFVDKLGTLYVADSGNHRVMRWRKDATQGTIIVGGNYEGSRADQLSYPIGLTFDRQGNLYVGDVSNYRVQRFSIQ